MGQLLFFVCNRFICLMPRQLIALGAMQNALQFLELERT